MPIFKIFDYCKNDLNDYKLFYELIRRDGHKSEVLDELPDNFFEPEDFDLIEDMINDDDANNYDNNDKNNSEKSINHDIDESEFDEFDWSEPVF